jgi:hypothetical protein
MELGLKQGGGREAEAGEERQPRLDAHSGVLPVLQMVRPAQRAAFMPVREKRQMFRKK